MGTPLPKLGVAEFTLHHCDQQEAVLRNIRDGKAEEAGHAMRRHLEVIAAAMQQVRSPS